MADSRDATLWYEDLECHRQPSIYYLGREEGVDGSHLICDWNGAPTDFGEIDIDILRMIREKETILVTNADNQVLELNGDDSDFVDYPNPTIDIGKCSDNNKSRTHSSKTPLTENDGACLDFLTVAPIARSLLQRLSRSQKSLSRPSTIPEEREEPKLVHSCPMTDNVDQVATTKTKRAKLSAKLTARMTTNGLAKTKMVRL